MTREQKIKAQADRIKTVKKWPKRLQRLIAAKEKQAVSYSERQFCKDHGFCAAAFNRGKNLANIPSEETVKKVEQALESCGV